MKSIGILLYGELTLDKVMKALKHVTDTNGIDYTKYEIVLRQIDTETMYKIGYFVPEEVSDYLRMLSPNIYNLYIDRPDLLTDEEQVEKLFEYLKAKDGLLIAIISKDLEELPEHDSELMEEVRLIKVII